MGLRLSEEKTVITHIDDGLDFLGFGIRRHPERGAVQRYVYTYPSKAAVASIKAKVRRRRRGDDEPVRSRSPVRRLNPRLRGWTNISATGCLRRPSAT